MLRSLKGKALALEAPALYHASDGRELRVEWVEPEWPQYQWMWNEAHCPRPLTPLAVAMERLGAAGRIRAFEEAGVLAPPPFRGWQTCHGFQYMRQTPLPPAEQQEFIARAAALVARHGSPRAVWENYCRPHMQAACATLDGAGPEVPLQDLAETWSFGFHQSFVSLATLQPPTARMLALLAPLGTEAELVQFEILAGGANASQAADRAIWELAQMARSNVAVRALLEDGAGSTTAPAARTAPENEFIDAFERFVATYGGRASSWDVDAPTLREQPAIVRAMVRQAIASDRSPDEVEADSQRRREAALARAAEVLAGDPGSVSELRRLARQLEGYVAIREGRALWQLTNFGSLRHALLRRGAVLVDRGLLAGPADIFFLLPTEIDAALAGSEGSLKETAELRRVDWASWLAVDPPHWIGNPQASRGPLAEATPSELANVVQGLGASRGTVTARARLLRALESADTFQPGEILVCVMTSPPWTPLFAIAAAVVTDSGAPLSHPAITAREYGIPAVVGAKGATSRIRTGDLITVDGLAGTVRIERG